MVWPITRGEILRGRKWQVNESRGVGSGLERGCWRKIPTTLTILSYHPPPFPTAQIPTLDQLHELGDLRAHFFGGDGSLTGARQIAGAEASHQSRDDASFHALRFFK